MALNVLFSLLFSRWFAASGWMPHGGLALANSLATALESGLLLMLMRRRLGGLGGSSLTRGILRMTLAGAGMGLILVAWLTLQNNLPVLVHALGGIGLGAGVYWLMSLLFRVEESRSLPALVFEFRKRRA